MDAHHMHLTHPRGKPAATSTLLHGSAPLAPTYFRTQRRSAVLPYLTNAGERFEAPDHHIVLGARGGRTGAVRPRPEAGPQTTPARRRGAARVPLRR